AARRRRRPVGNDAIQDEPSERDTARSGEETEMATTEATTRRSEGIGRQRGDAPKVRNHPLNLHPKVAATGMGSLFATVVLWLLGLAGVHPPANVAAAICGLIASGLAWLAPMASAMVGRIQQDGEVRPPLAMAS